VGLELDLIKGILHRYCCALAGLSVDILDTQALVQKNIGWVHEDLASTDGTTVFLPSMVDRYADEGDNFAWFKVIATHQVSHLEFGSFTFRFEAPAAVFDDRRQQREQAAEIQVALPASANGHAYTAIGRFLRLFANRRLAFDLFTILEDARLDYRIQVEYPGIRQATRGVQADARTKRPALETLALQEALVELLMRLSLEQFMALPIPHVYADAARMLARLVHALRTARATVEDTAEATLRAYDIIARLPNIPMPGDQWIREDLTYLSPFSEADYEALLSALPTLATCNEADGDAYESPEPVDYRGEFKPDMVQILSQLEDKQAATSQPLSQDDLEQMLEDNIEWEWDGEQEERDQNVPVLAQNLMDELGMPPLDAVPPQSQGTIPHEDSQGGALTPSEPRTYVYDEWDFRNVVYKAGWCLVKEKELEEGDAIFYNDTLKRDNALLHHIRHQFERMMPERYRKTYRLTEGEDVDLNAALEAWADLRMNVPPDEKIYWRRYRVQRDVAVVFLLDMSASTAEAIDNDHTLLDDRKAPSDPAAYMTWLRNRRATLSRPDFKRIIDVEKESVVLLIQALELIGDTYGIYGFSGYGRDNVELYVIKDLVERFGERIKRRVDKITPLQATRMGPAIRHGITKLVQQGATTKVLILFSDGRPQDRGYSSAGAEKEYAVHDTRMALLEAKQEGITPFCLTVDKTGHDYMRAMCGDIGYEVLDDIALLPARLPMLYRTLTL
jgi:nitric oxide reductase activation protein